MKDPRILLDGVRKMFALPAMSDAEREAFALAQADARDGLVVPIVVVAVLMIASFVGWDFMRDPGQAFPLSARVRLGGAAAVLALLALERKVLKPGFRMQALILYCAIYASGRPRSAGRS